MEAIPAPLAVSAVPRVHKFLAAGALGDYEAGHINLSFESMELIEALLLFKNVRNQKSAKYLEVYLVQQSKLASLSVTPSGFFFIADSCLPGFKNPPRSAWS